MTFHTVDSHRDLLKGSFGLMEPPADAPEVDCSACRAAVVIPALCWDRSFHRIGYGGGYYDRWLPGFSGAKVGFCYADFMRQDLPTGRYDGVCDIIVTEKGVKTRDG